MPTYTAHFRTETHYADRDFEADSPQQALQLARAVYENRTETLPFEAYDGDPTVEEIDIRDEEDEPTGAFWQSDDLRVHLAARELLDALEQAVAALNTAPRFTVPGSVHGDSYGIAALCDAAIAKARPATPSA